jgi:hypothetical protein
MKIANSDEARIARAVLQSAMKKREACRVALMAHETHHQCAMVLLSA